MLRGIGIGAHQENAPVGILTQAGPDFLAVNQEIVPVQHRLRLQRRQVGSGIGLRKSLAPDLVGIENLGNVALLLGLGAVLHEGRANDADPQAVGRLRRPGAGHFLPVNGLLNQRSALTAVFPGPVYSHPAAIVQPALPGAAEGKIGVLIRRRRLGRLVGLKPGSQLQSVFFVFRRKSQVHGEGSTACGQGAKGSRPRGIRGLTVAPLPVPRNDTASGHLGGASMRLTAGDPSFKQSPFRTPPCEGH